MNHKELIEYGCEYVKAEDHLGDTHSGYWMPGDGDGKGYGDFLGATPEAATEALGIDE